MTSRACPAKIFRGIACIVLVVLTISSIAGCSVSQPGNGTAEPVTPQPNAASTDTLRTEGAKPGISEDSVTFGQSAAFSGPAQELGRNMRLGIEAAFSEVNRQAGGVHGRQLLLASLDDSYEPEAAIANTKCLINPQKAVAEKAIDSNKCSIEEGVFALIGAVGTPTSRSATPVAADAGIPYIAPFTGAEFLRDKNWTNIINLRASYYQETEKMVDLLTRDLGVERIAIMYQDDSFGRAGYRGVRAALDRRGMQPVSIGVYPRNTTAIKTGLVDVRRGSPEAVIMIGAYAPVAEMVSWTRHIGLDPVFMTVSFVGSKALANRLEHLAYEHGLESKGEGVVVTQVVPFPTGDSEVAESYRKALADYAPDAEPGFVSFEGYLAGRLAIFGLESCGREVDRECFLDGLRSSGRFDIDGFQLGYGEGDNQGSDTVFVTAIDENGNYRPVQTLKDFQR